MLGTPTQAVASSSNTTPLRDTSSSPSRPSTAASSAAKESTKGPDAMEVDEDQSSDVEVVEVGDNTVAEKSEQATKKRPFDDSTPIIKAKRTRVAAEKVVKSTVAKGKQKEENPLVNFKNGNFTLKQKALPADSTSSTMRGRLAFTDYFAQLMKDEDAVLEEWPAEHWGVVARIVHESEKSLSMLVKQVRTQIASYIEGSMAMGDDSQEAGKGEQQPLIDRIPAKAMQTLIESLAARVNYGIDLSDVSTAEAEGLTETPVNLQMLRWEVHDFELLPAELETKLQRRKTEREEAKSAALVIFLELPSTEQSDLLRNIKKGKGVKDTATTDPVPSSSAQSTSKTTAVAVSKKKKVVVDTADTIEKAKVKADKAAEKAAEKAATALKNKLQKDVEKAGKDALKAGKDAEKEADRAAAATLKAEKDEKNNAEKAKKDEEKETRRIKKEAELADKAAKAAERKAKEDEKLAKLEKQKAQLSKQSGIMNNFFVQRSKSPAPTLVSPRVSNGKDRTESDFDRTFKPFHIKNGAEIADFEKFVRRRGKFAQVEINSMDKETPSELLATFLAKIPPHRRIPYNPHPAPEVSVRETMESLNEAINLGGDAEMYSRLLNDRSKVQVKLLKFKDDVRPGYVGTWTKTSKVVGPRTPFGMDTHLLRYDYDSEEEWEEDAEEEKDAEDVDSAGEASAEDDSDALSDDWMCDDDEVEFEAGHDGEEEMRMDMDDDIMIMESETEVARRKILEREKKAKASREGAKKKKSAGPMLPLVKGPEWECEIGAPSYLPFKAFLTQFLNDHRKGTSPIFYNLETISQIVLDPKAISKLAFVDQGPLLPLTPSAPPTIPTSNTVPGTADNVNKMVARPQKALPTHLMSRFATLVHNSEQPQAVLSAAIYVDLAEYKISKATIGKTISEVATKIKGKWIVKPEVLATHLPSAMIVE